MKKEKMDLWMKSSLEGHASPVPVGGWKGLHQGRKKKKGKLLVWFAVACLILFAGFAIWNFGTDPARDQLSQTENAVPQKHAKSSKENKNGPGIPPAENGTNADKVHLKGSTDHPAPLKKNRLLNTKYPEVPASPESSFGPVPEMQSLRIGNKLVASVHYSIKEEKTPRLEEKSRSRISGRVSFYAEAGLSAGNLVFADDAYLALYRPSYSTYIKSQDLRQVERKIGFVVYYQCFRRGALGSGLSLSHNTASGRVDYAYYESSRNLVNLGTQNWPDNTLGQTENLSHTTTISSWNIHVPLRFRYQPFAFYGPYMEIGACYSYNLSNQGEWLDPETLMVVQSRNLVPKHLFSAELSVGYQWKFTKTSVSLNYRFSPWSGKYAPIQGRMGTNLHGIHIQMQLSH